MLRKTATTTQSAIKPATPLPFSANERGNTFHDYTIKDANGRSVCIIKSSINAAYIVHAGNAYPELVAALRDLVDLATVLAACSSDRAHHGDDGINPARALLAKLGEGA